MDPMCISCRHCPVGNTDTEEEAMAIIQVGTRKGLFAYKKKGSGVWTMSNRQFVGDPVNLVMKDPRDGSLCAYINETPLP